MANETYTGRISRPQWMTLQEELSIRKEMNIGKLAAVKLMRDLGTAKGYKEDCGLKACKDFVDQLEKIGPDPQVELRKLYDQLQQIEREFPLLAREAFPHLTEEASNDLLSDRSKLERLLKNGVNANKYGI